MIYFDNAATTYPKPEEVYKAIDYANRNAFNSGRGSYKMARKMSDLINTARKQILEIGDIAEGKVVFTPSATVALNNIILGMDYKQGDYIYVSPFEHNSVIRPLEFIKEKYNINIEIIPFNRVTWNVDTQRLNDMFTLKKPKAVILSQVSNATGYMLPYEEVFNLSEKYNAINIIDSSQSYGILNINTNNISYIVFAGHKSLYATFGIAGYVKLKTDILNKSIFGGTGSDTMNRKMEDSFPGGYEAGSSNVVAIAGLETSIKWLKQANICGKETDLTEYLINKLIAIKNVKLYLPSKPNRVFGIVSFNIENYKAEDIGKILDDEYEIVVRTGFHCAPMVHHFIDSLWYNGTVRISLGYFNTKEEIDVLVDALETL